MGAFFNYQAMPLCSPQVIITTLIVVTLLALSLRFLQVGKRETGLPPGPPTLPLIGNLHLLPPSGLHFQFVKWAKQYGNVFSLKLGPGTMIVLNDRQSVRDLLDVKSSIYSSRPDLYVLQDIITRGNHPLPMRYNDRLRRMRKTIIRNFREDLCNQKHLPVVEAEASQMIKDFFDQPEQFMAHPKRFSNSVLMSQVFGVRTPTMRAKHLIDFYTLMDRWAEVGETGATPPVDIIPIFKYLPEALWRNWKTRAQHVGALMQSTYGGFGKSARQRYRRGETLDSIMGDLLDQQAEKQIDDGELNFTCAIMIEAGTDTSASMILAALNALTKWPDVQFKAQAELDRVITEARSPRWEDYQHLPYVACVVKETMRWRPTAPIAFPHANTEDDVYKGMVIPKNSTIILNTWGIHNDPAEFPEPEMFNPDRYKNQTKPATEYINTSDPSQRDHYGYGAGRRSCPGIYLAERMLFVSISKLLWAFNFSPRIDVATGQPMDINVDFDTGYNHGFVYCAKDFPAKITLRDASKRQIILDEVATAESQIFSEFKIPETY